MRSFQQCIAGPNNFINVGGGAIFVRESRYGGAARRTVRGTTKINILRNELQAGFPVVWTKNLIQGVNNSGKSIPNVADCQKSLLW